MLFFLMLHLCHIDPIIVQVRAEPFDPYDALFEINRYDKPIAVALNIENHPLCRHDARRCIEPSDIGRAPPMCLPHLLEPRIASGFERCLILMPGSPSDEVSQRAPRNNSHGRKYYVPKMGARLSAQEFLG